MELYSFFAMGYGGVMPLGNTDPVKRSIIVGTVGVTRDICADIEGLSSKSSVGKTVMMDATYLKAHRTASSLRLKRGSGRLIGRTKGGMNTKLHAVSDAQGRPSGYTSRRDKSATIPEQQP